MTYIIFKIKLSFYLFILISYLAPMLSTSSKYAIKAVLWLALHSDYENKIKVKDIGKPINVPPAYLAKLLQALARQGVISSTKGPKGGFYLSEANRNLPLINVIEVIDGGARITSCLLGFENCNAQKPCPLHALVAASRQELVEKLETRTIDSLSTELEKGQSFLPL
ncbi:RrF2 family transcriptional regulator [Spongiimicrobium sp. 3-5]|uniref:RrF2 family transcriptional regulator n=1 Tax=Spongiimicrobium sp. 3-5 TaxID=3332596 RepID=UPI003981546C